MAGHEWSDCGWCSAWTMTRPPSPPREQGPVTELHHRLALAKLIGNFRY